LKIEQSITNVNNILDLADFERRGEYVLADLKSATWFFECGKGPSKGQIPGLLGHLKYPTVLLFTADEQTNVKIFSSLDAIAAEK
jgi:hypothetical protein